MLLTQRLIFLTPAPLGRIPLILLSDILISKKGMNKILERGGCLFILDGAKKNKMAPFWVLNQGCKGGAVGIKHSPNLIHLSSVPSNYYIRKGFRACIEHYKWE